MSLHPFFTRGIYWPLAQKLKGEYAAAALEELSESQWKTRDELIDMQWQRVRATVNKAIREVPYYFKRCADLGWNTGNKNFSYKDFLGFPTVEKETVRDRVTEFLNPNYQKRVTIGRTSGSTGQSLTLYYNSEHESYSEAARWRAKKWWGVGPGLPQVSIWGRPYTGVQDRISQKVKSFLMNNLLVSAFEIDEASLSSIWEKISRFKPSIIYGYPSAIYPLAVFLRENNKDLDALDLKVVMMTAESITVQQKSLIEEVFGCKAANEYGCSETGGFVYECPHGSWHIASELTFIEFLDPEGRPVEPGQTGEIYLTHLRNDYMPLIRYRVGDRGSPLSDDCPCGRGLPLMNVSVAKESEIVHLADGKNCSSEIFDYISLSVSKAYPNSILQFRVVQKNFDLFELEVVPGTGPVNRAQELFKKLIKKQLGPDIRIHFKRVPGIERDPSGKLRYFISEIAKESF
jgi:phenylacetate-CoA ligase